MFYFSLVCDMYMYTVCHGLFVLSLGVNGRLCSVTVALPWTSSTLFCRRGKVGNSVFSVQETTSQGVGAFLTLECLR